MLGYAAVSGRDHSWKKPLHTRGRGPHSSTRDSSASSGASRRAVSAVTNARSPYRSMAITTGPAAANSTIVDRPVAMPIRANRTVYGV